MAAQVIGAKVRIEVNNEGSYEGYVHNIDGATKKLTLAKGWLCGFCAVYILSNGVKLLLLVCVF